ncbi:helix-turn-helix transcriptional regulator [Aquicoccus sp. G2-2]|uniref:helix-turn-helix transcriptional regulator n=1 Tax=Aquicoccus sp. G2-2 TaxID=3092120 RepID=UPI002AE06D79|nr:helix-turn-helix domain-containing protein [Aquicoccus sp. G2-2]MEA1115062.1 helix-turn-helix domain-containing protein [Aquicoccus sp. G2-2]
MMNALTKTETTDRLMDEKEAASILCYSVRALQNWRHRGGGPKYIRVSARSIRYTHGDLIEWINRHRVANSSQPPTS